MYKSYVSCLMLHCFRGRKFCLLPRRRLAGDCQPVFQAIKSALNVASLCSERTFKKSGPICQTALVENVFRSRQNFLSFLSTENYTDFSQWNLLEFIGSWLAVTD